jgi:hypothetical protein
VIIIWFGRLLLFEFNPPGKVFATTIGMVPEHGKSIVLFGALGQMALGFHQTLV